MASVQGGALVTVTRSESSRLTAALSGTSMTTSQGWLARRSADSRRSCSARSRSCASVKVPPERGIQLPEPGSLRKFPCGVRRMISPPMVLIPLPVRIDVSAPVLCGGAGIVAVLLIESGGGARRSGSAAAGGPPDSRARKERKGTTGQGTRMTGPPLRSWPRTMASRTALERPTRPAGQAGFDLGNSCFSSARGSGNGQSPRTVRWFIPP